MRHINRLIEPTAGQILVDGTNVLDLKAKELRDFRNRRVSMVFQNFGLMSHRTVLQNVVYGQRVRGLTKADATPISGSRPSVLQAMRTSIRTNSPAA